MEYQPLTPEQVQYLAALIAGDQLLNAHPPPREWAGNVVFDLAYRWAQEASLRRLAAA